MKETASLPEDCLGPRQRESLLDLAEQYGGALRRFFRRRIRDVHEADDALQETYVRLLGYEREDRLHAPGALAFRIAQRVVYDRHRQRTARQAEAHVPLGELDLASTAAGPEQVASRGQQMETLALAIEELSADCRRVFLLSRLHGLKRQEIAAHLGISVKMVDKHLGRAMAHCRHRLGAEPR